MGFALAKALRAAVGQMKGQRPFAQAVQQPQRFLGLHYFNPVALMPLVEIVRQDHLDPANEKHALAFCKAIDKLPVPVKGTPGFLVNRILMPYLLEAMRLFKEGVPGPVLDKAAKKFGMPMGPIELADTVGLDIAMAAGKQLAGGAEPPRCLIERVEKKQLGKKSGAGFYDWSTGRAKKPAAGAVPAGLADRLITPLMDRVEKLVADGVVADSALADAGVIFGTGFAPFTGGPMHFRAQSG